jgi:ribosomal protein L11 methylase PrmA
MQKVAASFKDPSGFVFNHENEYYRNINSVYSAHYNHLMDSGLYDHLCKRNLFLAFEECQTPSQTTNAWKTIKPLQLSRISYASEWSFDMYKDAARCTLHNCIEALDFGMVLKDANTFNIQFHHGKPILIDSLSFEKYKDGQHWVAYRQFVEQFICPLVLMKYNHLSLQKMTIAYPNGIPIDVCKSLLPKRARLNPNVYLHIILAAKKSKSSHKATQFSIQKLRTLLRGLLNFVEKISLPKQKTIWDDYYTHTILGDGYFTEKESIINKMLDGIDYNSVVDYGANDGAFSRLLAQKGKEVIAADIDYNCINRLYQANKKEKIKNIFPVVLDLTNPTPSFGWAAQERSDIFSRLQSDVSLCLALVHHLAIQHNIPLPDILNLFHQQSEYLLIEFVEKTDAKVQLLLESREDIFETYTLEHFKETLAPRFTILQEQKLQSTDRTLFLLKRKNEFSKA